MAKITYTCSRCELRFLASDNPGIFPSYQRSDDGKITCLLCTQLKPETMMAKAKKGPARKESKKDKVARKAQETAKKVRLRRGPAFVPPNDGEW